MQHTLLLQACCCFRQQARVETLASSQGSLLITSNPHPTCHPASLQQVSCVSLNQAQPKQAAHPSTPGMLPCATGSTHNLCTSTGIPIICPPRDLNKLLVSPSPIHASTYQSLTPQTHTPPVIEPASNRLPAPASTSPSSIRQHTLPATPSMLLL
jgi:hypothetical protein